MPGSSQFFLGSNYDLINQDIQTLMPYFSPNFIKVEKITGDTLLGFEANLSVWLSDAANRHKGVIGWFKGTDSDITTNVNLKRYRIIGSDLLTINNGVQGWIEANPSYKIVRIVSNSSGDIFISGYQNITDIYYTEIVNFVLFVFYVDYTPKIPQKPAGGGFNPITPPPDPTP